VNILAVYERTFGFRPKQLDLLGLAVSPKDVDPMIENWQHELEFEFEASHRRNHDVYPLVSHHPFNELSLFGSGPRESIGERALMMLFAHDGLVCSDPMWEMLTLREREGLDAAATALTALTGRIAEVESLIETGVLLFRSVRPSLSSSSRSAVLRAFGVDSNMQVFTNFAEAADTAAMIGGSEARSYIDQGAELSFRLGVLTPDLKSRNLVEQVEETRQRVQRLGRALIHLSWQLAVASENDAVDLALANETETSLFEYLLDSTGIVRPHHREGAVRTRHLLRTAAGEIPNMDRIELSGADALAIRNDDTFAEFRQELHAALDELESRLADPLNSASAAAAFRARMADASAILKAGASKASFSQVVKASSIPIGIEAAVAASTSSDDQMRAAAFAGAGAVATVVWSWLQARQTPESTQVAIRYTSALGMDD
jgi:hypothetical protein